MIPQTHWRLRSLEKWRNRVNLSLTKPVYFLKSPSVKMAWIHSDFQVGPLGREIKTTSKGSTNTHPCKNIIPSIQVKPLGRNMILRIHLLQLIYKVPVHPWHLLQLIYKVQLLGWKFRDKMLMNRKVAI